MQNGFSTACWYLKYAAETPIYYKLMNPIMTKKHCSYEKVGVIGWRKYITLIVEFSYHMIFTKRKRVDKELV